MPEWLHYWGGGEGIRDLGNCSEPTPYICERGGGGEGEDRLLEAVRGLDPCGRDIEPKILHSALGKLKLCRVKDDAVFTAFVKEITSSFECNFNSGVIKQGIINAALLPLKFC